MFVIIDKIINFIIVTYMKNIAEKIQSIGLSNKESLVYIYILENGGAYPSAIAESTKINRSTVYKILIDLSVKGIINEVTKGKKLFYQVENPKKILRYKKDQLNLVNEQYEKLEKALPALEGLYAAQEGKPKITYYEGLDGIREVYRDHFDNEEKYEMLAFGDTATVKEFFAGKFGKEYVHAKEKNKIVTRGIVPDTDSDKSYNKDVYKGVSKKYHPQLKHISKDIFPWKGDVTVYGTNKVSIIDHEQNKWLGLIIEDRTIHNMLKMIFELAWVGADHIDN